MKTKGFSIESVEVVQDVKKAIEVLRDAGRWLEESGKNPSKWWRLENLNEKFLLQYAKPNEFYVFLIDGEPAGAQILQINKQDAQDWATIDKGNPKSALYLHWECVKRKFVGTELHKAMTEYAEDIARGNNLDVLRLDTDADNMKLRSIYEKLGFKLVGETNENYRKTAFYEKSPYGLVPEPGGYPLSS